MAKDFNIVVFISGRGSNLAGLIAAQQFYRIQAVISNNPKAPGLKYAESANIPRSVFDRRAFSDVQALKAAIRQKTIELRPDLIALAGYMLIVEPDLIELFPDKIINIHPSLLPAYPGLDTHQRVLADQNRTHGCTVHQVDTGLDTGPIISQAQLNVESNDNVGTLSQRVLELEHKLYPWTVNALALGQIKLNINKLPDFSADALDSAKAAGFILGGRIRSRGIIKSNCK